MSILGSSLVHPLTCIATSTALNALVIFLAGFSISQAWSFLEVGATQAARVTATYYLTYYASCSSATATCTTNSYEAMGDNSATQYMININGLAGVALTFYLISFIGMLASLYIFLKQKLYARALSVAGVSAAISFLAVIFSIGAMGSYASSWFQTYVCSQNAALQGPCSAHSFSGTSTGYQWGPRPGWNLQTACWILQFVAVLCVGMATLLHRRTPLPARSTAQQQQQQTVVPVDMKPLPPPIFPSLTGGNVEQSSEAAQSGQPPSTITPPRNPL